MLPAAHAPTNEKEEEDDDDDSPLVSCSYPQEQLARAKSLTVLRLEHTGIIFFHERKKKAVKAKYTVIKTRINQ